MVRRFSEWRKGTNGTYADCKKKRAAEAALPTRTFRTLKLDGRHVLCLPALGSFDDVELDRLSFFQAAEAVRLNRRKMHEDIFTVLAADEPEALSVIEPLYDSLFHGVTRSFLIEI